MRKKLVLLAAPVLAVASLASLTGCGKKYDLVIYNWEDYIYEGTDDDGRVTQKGTIKRFEEYYEKEHGQKISVAYETFSTNEDMYKQIKMGSLKADLICPSDYMIQKMANEGRLEPFSYNASDDSYEVTLKNWDTYGSPFIRQRFAAEKLLDGSSFLQYSVPYFWGTMGFTYDYEWFVENDLIDEISSWECLWSDNPLLKNKFSLKDSMRDTYVAAIFHVYRDEILALDENDAQYNNKLSAIFNRCDDATIEKVEKALKEVKNSTVYGFEVDEGKDDIVRGTYRANLAWSGDSVYSMDSAEEAGKTLNYSLPKEGSNVWFDGWCMPKGARKQIAEEFVNFICSPEEAALCMSAVGYTSPIAGQEIWDMISDSDWYGAEEGEEDIDEVDLGFYFGDTIEGDGVISVPSSERGRQFDAQYPTEDVLKHCCLMKDFGDQQTKVEEMWNRVTID